MLRHRVGGVGACVTDRNAVCAAVVDVDVVVARGEQPDIAQLFGIAQRMGVHQRLVADHHIRVRDLLGDLLIGEQAVLRDLSQGAQGIGIDQIVDNRLRVGQYNFHSFHIQ